MDDSKTSPSTVKVVDRRKFTPDGEPRDESQEARASAPEDASSPEPVKEAQPQEPMQDNPSPEQSDSNTSRYFVELVDSLAHQAAILLSGAEGQPARPTEAKRVIDYLGMLEEKTAGNLSTEEKRFLGDVMFQLRSAYLKST